MPITAFDPTSALVVIDLQQGIVALPPTDHARQVVDRSAELAAAFRARGLPVVLVNVAGAAPGRTEQEEETGELPEDFFDLVPELDAQSGDILVTKTRWGAFHGTDLHELLFQRGVTQVVITGIATSMGVESTARAAHEHGYHVVLVTDAMADLDAAKHDHSVEKVFPLIGQTGPTADVLALLSTDTETTTSSSEME